MFTPGPVGLYMLRLGGEGQEAKGRETVCETGKQREKNWGKAMLRGFLSGIIWGAIVSAIVAAAASLFAPLPGRQALRALAAEASSDQRSPQVASQPQIAGGPGSLTGPATSDDLAPSSGADTQSAPTPDTAAVTSSLPSPEHGEQAGLNPVAVQVEAPLQPRSENTPPALPSDDEQPSISADPLQPALAENTDQNGPAFPIDQQTAPQSAGPTPTLETDMTPLAEKPEALGGQRQNALPSVAPASDTSGRVSSEDGSAPESAPADQTELSPQAGRPALRLTDQPSEHESTRLPMVEQQAETGIVSSGGSAAITPASDTTSETSPVVRYAEDFSNPDNRPLMAIVLIDAGDSGIDTSVLSGFPYPLSFAINTLDDDANERMTALRDKGFEVLAMVDLPEFANASDVEVAMPAHLRAIPQAVAVLEGMGDGLQSSREISDQVTSVLNASGHGLVFLSKGLNTAQKLAARDGVPSATVFRDFDGKGQNAAAIRRFLDQAAFKAAQEDGVIMLGRLQPNTVSALLLWGLADRAGTVALAPVSALLSAQ